MKSVPTAGELAGLVGGRLTGNPETPVSGFASLEHAGGGDVTFAAGASWRARAKDTDAAVVVTDEPVEGLKGAQIIVPDPNLAFARIVEAMGRERARGSPGIHPSAVVDPGAGVHPEAAVRACAVVEAGASVGARSVIGAGAYVGHGTVVGEDCMLHPRAVLMHDVRLGDRVTVHSGAVIGADGFGYAPTPEGTHQKIPQVGTVVLEDDVEIGANSCVDRARFDATRIRKGTKIDDLVMVAHNVQVGEHCLLAAQSGIAGSTRLDGHVVLGGHVGVAGHIRLGEGAQVGAYSGVGKDLPAGQAYVGIPAVPLKEGLRIRALSLKLPGLWKRIQALEARLAEPGDPEGVGR